MVVWWEPMAQERVGLLPLVSYDCCCRCPSSGDGVDGTTTPTEFGNPKYMLMHFGSAGWRALWILHLSLVCQSNRAVDEDDAMHHIKGCQIVTISYS